MSTGCCPTPTPSCWARSAGGSRPWAKSLAVRCVAFGRRVYVPGDPKGEWSVVTRAVGGQVVELGAGRPTRLNPLDEGPRIGGVDDEAWRAQVTQRRLSLLGALTEATLGRPLGATERTALDAGLAAACDRASVPILPLVVDSLLDPERAWRGSSIAQLRDDGREVAHALGRRPRGPGRAVRGALDRGLRPQRGHGQPGPVACVGVGHPLGLGAGLHLHLDGGGPARPGRGSAPGRLRRGLAAHGPAEPSGPDAPAVEAVPGLGSGQPHDRAPPG